MSATISPCGLYRYTLTRGPFAADLLRPAPNGTILFVMLNPSTADATEDDPTIRRCIGFARTLGYTSLAVGNLFAWRATDPRELRTAYDPVGPDNDRHLVELATGARTVVAAWGAYKLAGPRGLVVRRLLADRGIDLHALRLTAGGAPGHPLYLPGALTPTRWAPP